MKKNDPQNISARETGFDESYKKGTPPWDIGRPQHEFVRLSERGEIKGHVLDIGCGTGENALFLAGEGLEVLGVDASQTAIDQARVKAAEKKSAARFEIADALHLERLGRKFDSVIDCGLFHVFSDDDRLLYEQSLASVVKPKGRYFVLCFSELESGTWGPRRVSEIEIRKTFGESRWKIHYIRPAKFETNFDEPDVHAWLASIEKS